MSRTHRNRKLENALSRERKLGFDIDERLEVAAQAIAEAEELFRRLAEPRHRS